jgi:putative oxidoreductase
MRMDRWVDGNSALALLAPRVSLGASMAYHGTSKLTPKGIEQASGFFEQVGIQPGKPWAIATAITEVLAGALTLLGIGTRFAALSVLVTQAVAVRQVHRPKGFDVQKGGYEFNAALMSAALALLLAGPGTASASWIAQRRLQKRRRLRILFRPRPAPALRVLAIMQ